MCLVLVFAAGCGKKESTDGDVLAVVNGQSIPLNNYYKTMERKQNVTAEVNPAQLRVDPGSGRLVPQVTLVKVEPSLALQALQECLVNEIVRQVGKDDGIYPNEADINAEIKLQEERNPNFVKDASQSGFSLEQIKNDLALSLVRTRLQSKGVTVTDDEVSKFIKDNPGTFTQPALADLLYIEAPDVKTKDLADKELKEGQMFAAVAQRYSVQANGKEMKFAFPVREMNRMTPMLQKLVEKTREFSATDWVQDGGTKRWVKFYVSKKTKAQPVKITNYVREMVKREVLRSKGLRANDPDKRVADKLKTAKIEIKVKYLEEPWKSVFKSLTKDQAPK